MASSEREDTRFAMLVLVVGYLVVFSSWLPVPRRLIARLTRSRYRREATVIVVLAIAIPCVIELITEYGPAVVSRGWSLWVPLGAALVMGLGSAIAAWRAARPRDSS
jgi:hypothetical protein